MENRKNVLIIGASSEIAQAVIQKLESESYTILTTSRQGNTTTYALDLTVQVLLSLRNRQSHFLVNMELRVKK
jgi:short-subunit dehydrogenase